jgi:antirestriction protein ArdC
VAPVFIRRKDGSPCRAWSWANQLLVALHGHSDVRGFRQWQQVSRHVRKGEKSFCILSPILKTRTTDDGKEQTYLVGFKGTAVFGLAQTDGQPLPEVDSDLLKWVESLPLVDVAREWGLSVETYSGRPRSAQGWYHSGHQTIALGVHNLSTWAHELLHAADDRLGQLSAHEAKWRKETVAELGGAVLLECLGQRTAADLGGCWAYVQSWCSQDGIEPVVACQQLLKRTCDAVSLVLETAQGLTAPQAHPAAEPVSV